MFLKCCDAKLACHSDLGVKNGQLLNFEVSDMASEVNDT